MPDRFQHCEAIVRVYYTPKNGSTSWYFLHESWNHCTGPKQMGHTTEHVGSMTQRLLFTLVIGTWFMWMAAPSVMLTFADALINWAIEASLMVMDSMLQYHCCNQSVIEYHFYAYIHNIMSTEFVIKFHDLIA